MEFEPLGGVVIVHVPTSKPQNIVNCISETLANIFASSDLAERFVLQFLLEDVSWFSFWSNMSVLLDIARAFHRARNETIRRVVHIKVTSSESVSSRIKRVYDVVSAFYKDDIEVKFEVSDER